MDETLRNRLLDAFARHTDVRHSAHLPNPGKCQFLSFIRRQRRTEGVRAWLFTSILSFLTAVHTKRLTRSVSPVRRRHIQASIDALDADAK
jgi:hypothetical protein